MHISCTICTDLVEPDENLHATRCGHVFHNHCLSDWIDRSSTCPQCRRFVTDSSMLRIYPTFSDEKDTASLQSRLHHALELNKELQTVCVEKEELLEKVKEGLRKNEESLEVYISELDKRNATVVSLKEQVEAMDGTNMQRLKDENASLKDNVRTLNGEMQRQNLLYSELMAQISLQRNSLEANNRTAARLREENEGLKKTLRTLSGELRRHKVLYDELRNQMGNVKYRTNTKQYKDGNISLENIELRPKIILNRGRRKSEPAKNSDTAVVTIEKSGQIPKLDLASTNAEPKKIEPQSSSEIQTPEIVLDAEKLNALCQKLSLTKSSHLKLSKTLVNLIFAWLNLKVQKVKDGRLSSGTSQNIYDDEFITRLDKILSINEMNLQLENMKKLVRDKIFGNYYEIARDLGSKTSKSEQIKMVVCNDDMQRISDFFTKLSESKAQSENIKGAAKIHSLSPIEAIKHEQYQNDSQNEIQWVLMAEKFKNYEKNFNSFDIGVWKKGAEHVKNNTGRVCTKPKMKKKVFEFDATRTFVARAALDSFNARPAPPELNNAEKKCK